MIKEEYRNGCRLKEQVKYNIDYDDCQILNLTCANYIYDLVQESSKYETKLEDIKKMLYMIEKLLGHEVQYDIPEYHKVIFASKLNDFTKNNTIYNIVRYIDLKGETLTIPENSVLNFIGGAIGNGTIIGNKTKVINLNVDRIILSGTWFDSGITSNRPTNVLVGFQYFDTTVNKPIFWDGSKWIDATGATV